MQNYLMFTLESIKPNETKIHVRSSHLASVRCLQRVCATDC